jgi:hypothetical protein
MPEVIKSLLRSRAFVTSVAAIIGIIVVTAIPTLEPHVDFLRNAIIALAGLVIGKWGLEDFAEKFGASSIPSSAQEIFDMLAEIVEALANKEDVQTETETTSVPDNFPLNG